MWIVDQTTLNLDKIQVYAFNFEGKFLKQF